MTDTVTVTTEQPEAVLLDSGQLFVLDMIDNRIAQIDSRLEKINVTRDTLQGERDALMAQREKTVAPEPPQDPKAKK